MTMICLDMRSSSKVICLDMRSSSKVICLDMRSSSKVICLDMRSSSKVKSTYNPHCPSGDKGLPPTWNTSLFYTSLKVW